MKYLRFKYKGQEKFGIFDGDNIIETTDYFRPIFKVKKKKYEIREVKFLTPSVPSKIIAVGLNYRKHAEELKMAIPENPVIFLKPDSSALPHLGEILYPGMSHRVDYEAELAVVIKTRMQNIPVKEVKKNILGYTCFNDVTARDLQKIDGQWTRAKSFDTFSPFGPFISDEINPLKTEVKLFLNTVLKQAGNTGDMIFNVFELVSFISRVMTLYPGDVIATGTPPGVGEMRRNDEVSVFIEGIGRLTNKII